MTQAWHEPDEHGNPPGWIVGFAHWSYLDQAVTALRERFGETAPEEDVVAYLTDESHLAATAEMVFRDVRARHPAWLSDQRKYLAGFERRLVNAYGLGLDRYWGFVELAREAAHQIHDRGDLGVTGEVLLDLHARACLSALEVHALLRAGFPGGALAAWRTTHETAVYASLLGEHGHDDEGRLARRWLAYADVERFAEAEIYQERVDALGYEPISRGDMDELKARADAADAEWGESLRRLNGWAGELMTGRVTFKRLQKMANLGHLYGHYRWASHRVHADGRGTEGNWATIRGRRVRLAGPTNVHGFVDAADLTSNALLVTTDCVLLNCRDDSPHWGEIVTAQMLALMRESVVAAFVEGHDIVEEAERLMVEEGVEEPLEDVAAWWTRRGDNGGQG